MSKFIFTKKNIINIIFMIAVYFVIQALITTNVINPFYQITLTTIGINIILAISLNLIIGFTGQFSLGHAGFMAIGAYVTAITLRSNPSTGGYFLGIVIGMVLAGVASFLIALPTLRLKGDYLAIATLGFGEIIRIIILNIDITGGAAGMSFIPRFTTWTYVYIGIIITILVTYNYIVSSAGRVTISINDDEIASEAMGNNTTKYKTISFVIGGMLAALAGGLYAGNFYVLKPETFAFAKSVDILVIVVFGGMGSVTGSIISAIVLGLVNVFLQSFASVRMIIYAVLLIVIMIFRPQGLMGTKEIRISNIFKRGGKK